MRILFLKTHTHIHILFLPVIWRGFREKVQPFLVIKMSLTQSSTSSNFIQNVQGNFRNMTKLYSTWKCIIWSAFSSEFPPHLVSQKGQGCLFVFVRSQWCNISFYQESVTWYFISKVHIFIQTFIIIVMSWKRVVPSFKIRGNALKSDIKENKTPF